MVIKALMIATLTVAIPIVPVRPDATQPAEQPRQDEAIERARDFFTVGPDIERLLTDRIYASEIIGHVDVLLPMAEDPDFQLSLRGMRVMALRTAASAGEAETAADTLMADHPTQPEAYQAAMVITWGNPDKMLAVIEKASRAATDDDRRATLQAVFPTDAVTAANQHFLAQDDDDARFRLAEALVALEWPGPKNLGLLDQFRSVVVEHRLEKGDVAGARATGAAITTTSPLLDLLIARKFDGAFESDIDRDTRIGTVISAQDASTLKAIQAFPGDVEATLARVQYLRSVGRNAEAHAIAMPIVKDWAEVAATGEDAFWLVNEAAYALLADGQAEEAIAMMERLQELGLEKHPYLISMAINHGIILDEAGRHEAAAAHAIRLAEEEKDYASAYGRMWMWSTAACALANQGKTDEAEAWLVKLRAGRDDNEAALSRALICLDRLDDAERLLISRLEGGDPSLALAALQNYELGGPSAKRHEILRERWDDLRQRPAVQQAVAKVGYVLSFPLSRSYWGNF